MVETLIIYAFMFIGICVAIWACIALIVETIRITIKISIIISISSVVFFFITETKLAMEIIGLMSGLIIMVALLIEKRYIVSDNIFLFLKDLSVLLRDLSVFIIRLNTSSDSLIKKIPIYMFSNVENGEEIIGDLSEQYEKWTESGYSNFKKNKNLLTQAFVIKFFLLKTKIENVFSMSRKINER